MVNLTLAQCFGANVVETSTTITILKSDLFGLMLSANNTANSILAGIINTAHQQFEGDLTDQNGISVTDQNSANVAYDNHLYYSSTWVQFWGYLLPKGKIKSVFIISGIVPDEN
ncbi:MAG: hypothetical protein V7L26_12115 [Nostoc sp.]|uniref:hypothetical protein n=1 Tax=Nostoc sp. TaxID=1180 RepID=UPI002FF2D14A